MKTTIRTILVLFIFSLLGACSSQVSPGTEPPSVVPPTATATSEPAAAIVNGTVITLASLEAEWSRYLAAQSEDGTELATDPEDIYMVLDARIDRVLLAQGASEIGIVIDLNDVAARIEQLSLDMGGFEAVAAWLAAQGYSVEEFELALQEDMLARAMVDHITADIARIQEHVHARHILVATESEAEELLRQLAAGELFDELARQYSTDPSTRPAGGDLGWFPRDALLIPEVEATAFNLADGERSGVVASTLGYHIIETLAREERVVTEDILLRQQDLAVSTWIEERRERADITVYITPEAW